jgi:hypothetical protein
MTTAGDPTPLPGSRDRDLPREEDRSKRVDAPDQGLLVASVLGRTLALVDQAVARLSTELGELAYVSEPLGFSWTPYYEAELGDHPARRVIALERLADASQLVEIKKTSNRIEVALSRRGGGREVNIDPGVLGPGQLVLASTKGRGHRIHLGRGIFVELTLLHGPDGFAALPWTYPDYASAELRDIFDRLRALLLESVRMRRTP